MPEPAAQKHDKHNTGNNLRTGAVRRDSSCPIVPSKSTPVLFAYGEEIAD